MPADRESERLNPYAPPALAGLGAPPPLSTSPAALRKVARGLSIYQTALILSLLSVAVAFVATLFVRLTHQGVASSLAVTRLDRIIAQFCMAMGLVGAICCLAVPRESKALPWIQASVVLGLLRWVIYAARLLGGTSYLNYYYGEYLLRLGAGVCFLLFLERASRTMLRNDLARRTRKWLWVYFPLQALSHAVSGPLPKEIDFRADVPRRLYIAFHLLTFLALFCLTAILVKLVNDVRLAVFSEDGVKLLNPPETS